MLSSIIAVVASGLRFVTQKEVLPYFLGILALLGILVGGWSLHHQAYQSGYEKAWKKHELILARSELAAQAHLASVLLEQQEELDVLLASNKILSEKIQTQQEVVIKEIDRVIKEQPIIVDSNSCNIDYGVVGVLNAVSRAEGNN